MKTDILSQISETISLRMQERLARYRRCGCVHCSNRAAELAEWLHPRKALLVPEEAIGEQARRERVPTPAHHVWLCHSCLRKVSAPTGRCPYCGTERHLPG